MIEGNFIGFNAMENLYLIDSSSRFYAYKINSDNTNFASLTLRILTKI